MSYLPSSGSVTFYDGDSEETFDVDIESSVFLPLGSTFTVTLTSVQFIGVGGQWQMNPFLQSRHLNFTFNVTYIFF